MKAKIASLILTAVLGAASTTPVLAHEDNSEAATLHWISHLAQAPSQPTANERAPFGYATARSAERSITLDGEARYLNVTRGETVQINLAGKSVTWTFDTLGTRSFALDKIIPGAGNITVYVAENPAYQG